MLIGACNPAVCPIHVCLPHPTHYPPASTLPPPAPLPPSPTYPTCNPAVCPIHVCRNSNCCGAEWSWRQREMECNINLECDFCRPLGASCFAQLEGSACCGYDDYTSGIFRGRGLVLTMSPAYESGILHRTRHVPSPFDHPRDRGVRVLIGACNPM